MRKGKAGLLGRFAFPWMFAATLLFTVWLIGQIVRDRSLIFGLMFYLPSPVIAFCLTVAAVAGNRRPQDRRFRRLMWGLPLMPIWFVLTVENQWSTAGRVADAGAASVLTAWESSTGSSAELTAPEAVDVEPMLRLVHWNIGWPARRWPAQRALLHQMDADIYVLSEISEAVCDQDFAGFQVLRRKKMLIACRGEMTASGPLVPFGVLHAFVIRCETGPGPLNIMIADMTSRPSLPRDPYLSPMMLTAEQRAADLIVGDMNAPRRSLAFSEMSGGYRHAYDLAGIGWSYTWPVPVPVLAIDQCICGPRVSVLRYELHTSLLSDHRLQLLDFKISTRLPVTDRS